MVKGKEQFTLWMRPEIKQEVAEFYKKDNCKSQSEFIEKSVSFYVGYLHTQRSLNFLPRILAGVLEGFFGHYGDRMGSLLFKQAVEQNIINNLIAADMGLTEDICKKLRARSIYEVRSSNGRIDFQDAVIYQSTD